MVDLNDSVEARSSYDCIMSSSVIFDDDDDDDDDSFDMNIFQRSERQLLDLQTLKP